jgi:hypothetical protein
MRNIQTKARNGTPFSAPEDVGNEVKITQDAKVVGDQPNMRPSQGNKQRSTKILQDHGSLKISF